MKKFLAFLLSFALICSMMTVVAFADSESNENVEENENVIALELVELDDEQLATLSYVPFSSGVYRFDSMYNTGMCMMVEDGEYTSGALVVQWNTSSNGCDTLFKVEHAGTGIIPASSSTADYYVIRSMVNSAIGLTAAPITSGSNAVTLQSLDEDNDNQMWTQYWVHMENSGCDVWMNAATGTCLGSPEGYANGSSLEMSSGGANTWWQLDEYTGPVIEGVVITSGATSTYGGGTYYYDAYMYSSEIGVNGPVVYGVRNGSGEANIVSSSGKLEPQKEGTVTVYATASGMTTEATRTVSITGYSSADYAAEAFSEEVYAASSYILHEFGTMIYAMEVSGFVTYDYGSIVTGEPHSVNPDDSICPLGVTLVAGAHTHPNSNSFTSGDKNWAEYYSVNLYVVGPNLKLQKYDYITNEEDNDVCDIIPNTLSKSEKETLKNDFKESWEDHIDYTTPLCDHGFDCKVKTWPVDN